MFGWSSAAKASLARSAIVICLLVTQFACNETGAVNAKAEYGEKGALISGRNSISNNSEKLRLRLNIDPASLAVGKVILRAALHNDSAQKVRVLRWNTPLDSRVSGNFMTVVQLSETETELRYVGRMVKRAAPIADDYISLDIGELATNDLDFTQSYKFCNNSRYIIKFTGSFYSDDFVVLQSESNAVEFETAQSIGSC
jgi:hypothetical protein